MKRKQCPVCKVTMRFNEIFPHIICWECSKHTQTKDGKDIEFYNDDVDGEIVSYIDASDNSSANGDDDSASDSDDDNDSYSTNIRDCYIGDYECSAQKGQFGEVIFQLKEN
mgnify:CR=1 FL=1